LRYYERPADHAASSFRAQIDPDLCTACGTCLDRCQIEAIMEGDDFMEVREPRCIGCGLCVPTCPAEAISLVPKLEVVEPPANVVEMNIRILKERGLS
jgi:ferredoxin